MKIVKLKYETREAGIEDLIEKGIIISDLVFCIPTHAVVYLGNGKFDLMIDDLIEKAMFDENGVEVTPDIYKIYDFGTNEVFPLTPDNYFAGWEPPAIIE